MTTAQKVIKYFAIALAVVIIANIISAIAIAVCVVGGTLGIVRSNNSEYLEEITTNLEGRDIATLKIDLKATNLIIKTGGDVFKAETNNSRINCKQDGNQLIIKEKNNFFSASKGNTLTVYIPENMLFEAVKISTGAGVTDIDNLYTKKLSLDMGAGKVQIKNLNVFDEAKINGGAGKVEILAGTIKNLDLDAGVGKFTLITKLTGKNDIDAGVGKLEIYLTDKLEDYTIKVSKGIGSITLEGKEMSDGETYGEGNIPLKIDGGIGAIEIKKK